MGYIEDNKKLKWIDNELNAENLNKVNEKTSNAFDEMDSSIDAKIETLKNNLVGSQAVEVAKNAKNVTKTLNGKELSGNSGIFEDDGTTVKNATEAKNINNSINSKPISNIFEDGSIALKQANVAKKALKSRRIVIFLTPPTLEDVEKLSDNELILYKGSLPQTRFDKVIYIS